MNPSTRKSTVPIGAALLALGLTLAHGQTAPAPRAPRGTKPP